MAGTRRRIGAESSVTRAMILESAEAVINQEGYAAASTRRVAAHAGLKPSLVHYYFPTTDDMLIAVFRKGAAESDEQLKDALDKPDPMTALWGLFIDSSRHVQAMEMMALANHRKTLRAEIAEHCEKMRIRQVAVIERLLGHRLARPGSCPPAGLSLVLSAIGRTLVMEGGLGITGGHEEARRWVEGWLSKLAADEHELRARPDAA